MSKAKNQDSRLVAETIEKLRELVFASDPDTFLGSMNDVAKQLGVGIVTTQQATRILEHEGLLAIKRGPGGGYYGIRPNDEALERSFSAFMRSHNIDYTEAFETTVSLDCDLVQAAAELPAAITQTKINDLLNTIELCENAEDCIQFEVAFRGTLFDLVDKPLLQLLARVAMQQYKASPQHGLFDGQFDLTLWRVGRKRILRAILAQDSELAYFEAQRYRTLCRSWIRS
ncbi:hypothetical protein [Halioxenophilus aromaticivorans]|uniref:FadR/GntR family transcriptional regulator n=1 Tax=Halioxenophilus aromaticivorans TaxID=1306992 RepID=UPI0031F181A0